MNLIWLKKFMLATSPLSLFSFPAFFQRFSLVVFFFLLMSSCFISLKEYPILGLRAHLHVVRVILMISFEQWH